MQAKEGYTLTQPDSVQFYYKYMPSSNTGNDNFNGINPVQYKHTIF